MHKSYRTEVDSNCISNEYELSNAQKRIWFHQEVNKQSTAYNLSKIITFETVVDIGVLEKTVNYMIQRHEALRTVIKEYNGIPKQVIKKYSPIKLSVIDLGSEQGEELLQSYINKDNNYVFDLAEKLFFIRLYKLEEEKYVLYLAFHHIIFDGWSQKIFDKELMFIYHAFLNNNQPELPEIKKQHLEWINEKKAWLQTDESNCMKHYWMAEIGGDVPKLEMPIDFARPKEKSFRGKYVTERIKGADVLVQIAKRNEVSMHVLLLTVYVLLLHKVTAQQDIVVGIPFAERSEKEIENTIGVFINTLPIRIQFEKLTDFYELLAYVKKKNSTAICNGKYPYDLMMEMVNSERDIAIESLYSTLFQYYDLLPMENGSSLFDLSFLCRISGEYLEFRINYSTDVLKVETVNGLAKYYINLIKQIIEKGVDVSLENMELMDIEEKREVICKFNDTKILYDKHLTLNQFFENQVDKTPNAVAVLFNGYTYTYRNINDRANRLARVLRKNGVMEGCIVAIMMERCVELVVSVLAILKAGGAYLPIDLAYPKERIDYILYDSKASWLVTRKQDYHEINFDGKVFCADDDFCDEESSNLVCVNESHSIAYVIYTSGTTGIPKGVLVEHRSVINRLLWMKQNIFEDTKQIFVLKTTYVFDVSVYELFMWYLVGGKLCVLLPGEEKNPKAIIESIDRYKITAIHFVPTMLHAFLQYVEASQTSNKLKTLLFIFSSGEVLQINQVELCLRIFKKTSLQLYNLYGPTEAAIEVTACNCFKTNYYRSVPIGTPISNVRIYIVDKNNNIQPVGIPGELCIAGDALARGYLNKPELTRKKFEIHPFSEKQNPFYHETVIYRTGDLAKWRYDGTIEYIGRLDSQVKIHGYRIELDDIRSNILKHDKISDAVVIINSKKQICMFFVSQCKLVPQDLRTFLSQYLPDYMIPTCYCQLNHLPLNHNGKIDVSALENIEVQQDVIGYEPVVSELQDEIKTIWSELLGISKNTIHVTDRYFALGGNSILLIQLQRLLMTRLGVEIDLVDLFTFNTIEKIERYILEKRLQSCVGDNRNEECCVKSEYSVLKMSLKEVFDRYYASKSMHYNSVNIVLFAAFLTLIADLSDSLILVVRQMAIKGEIINNPSPIDLSMINNFNSFIELIIGLKCEEGDFTVCLAPINWKEERMTINVTFVNRDVAITEFSSKGIIIFGDYRNEEIKIGCSRDYVGDSVIRILMNKYMKIIEAIIHNM